MKAKIKPLIILIAIFVAALTAALATGCNIGEQTAKERAEAMGMTASVTYYANGGTFISGTIDDDKVYRTDYYYPNSPIFNIGFDKTGGQPLTIERTGYVFAGWEYAKLDGNGLPILYELRQIAGSNEYERTGNTLKVLENGTASIKGNNGRELNEYEKRFEAEPNGQRVFDNGHPKVGAREHVYLVATWAEDVRIDLEYRLITDAPITVAGQAEPYENGDVIETRTYGANENEMTLNPNTSPKSFSGFSYIHLYWDAEGTIPYKSGEPIAKETATGENPVIYAKYLSGTWTAVRTAANAASMLNASGNGNYFVVFDINCEGNNNFSYKTAGNFSGVIDGNNKIISNITVSTSQQQGTGSLLGNLGATAKIRNLTIENVKVNLSVNGSFSAYLLATTVADGAQFDNFTINNVTFDIKVNYAAGAKLDNIPKLVTDDYDTGNWLYGGYSTDAEFIAAHGEIVKNATLKINDEEIVTGGLL